jgi:hypothetical protein
VLFNIPSQPGTNQRFAMLERDGPCTSHHHGCGFLYNINTVDPVVSRVVGKSACVMAHQNQAYAEL